MTNRPEGDIFPLISSEMIIYIRPSAHASNGLIVTRSIQKKPIKGYGVWGYLGLNSSFLLQSYYFDAPKPGMLGPFLNQYT